MARRQAAKRRSRRQAARKGSHARQDKAIERVNEAIAARDLPRLQSIGRQRGGFVNDNLRRKAWPILLHCAHLKGDAKAPTIVKHKDEDQVRLDVIRSFNAYPRGIDSDRKQDLQDALNRVIVQVLRPCPGLNYYQGFHDICTVFLLVFDEKQAITLLENVSLFYLRDAMLETLEPILRELTLLDTLLRLEDEELYSFLNESGVLPYYCLSWVITWFSHDLNDIGKITRLFDLFLCSNPMMPLYVSAAVVLLRRDLVLAMPCEASEVHHFLSKLPQNLDVEALVQHAIELEQRHSPLTLQKEGALALDTVSTINTYDSLWANCSVRTLPASRRRARAILDLSPEKRIPLTINNNKRYFEMLYQLKLMSFDGPTIWAWLILGVGVGTTAALLANKDIMRDWLALSFL